MTDVRYAQREGGMDDDAAALLKSLNLHRQDKGYRGRRYGRSKDEADASSMKPTKHGSKAQRKSTTRQEEAVPVIRHYEQDADGSFSSIEDMESEIKQYKAIAKELGVAAEEEDREKDVEAQARRAAQKAWTESLRANPMFQERFDIATRNAQQVIFNIPPSLPTSIRATMSQLNEVLVRIAVEPEVDIQQKVWVFYARCRKFFASNTPELSTQCWALLWQIFSREAADNTKRMARVLALADDMDKAGITLTDLQLLFRIEAQYVSGATSAALNTWRKEQVRLMFESSIESQYWALGSRMFSYDGSINESIEAAARHFEISQAKMDPTILVPIIGAFLCSEDPHAVQKAWAYYIRLRIRMGGEMTMELYTACIGTFMTADRADLALSVFNDMMMHGREHLRDNQDSINVYCPKLRISASAIERMELLSPETVWHPEHPPVAQPITFKNRFHYQSLIKKLLGERQETWAMKVAVIMAENGFPADAKVWNGIIGSLIRSGGAKATAKAEELAWKMIDERVALVKQRSQRLLLLHPEGIVRRWESSANLTGFRRIESPVSGVAATAETFAILAELYNRGLKDAKIKDLCNVVRPAEIKPTTDFLTSMVDYGRASDRERWSWQLYTQMTTQDRVLPDWETFFKLWNICKHNFSKIRISRDGHSVDAFPGPRALFAEMMKWKHVLQRSSMPRQLHHEILHAFGLSDDQIGTGIALWAMKLSFKISPDELSARSLVLQLAKAGVSNRAGHRSRRASTPNSVLKPRVEYVNQILAQFQVERVRAIEQQGKSFEGLSSEELGEHMLLLLCDLLQFVVQKRTEGTAEFTNDRGPSFIELAQVAAAQMGIVDISKLPWEVSGSEEGKVTGE